MSRIPWLPCGSTWSVMTGTRPRNGSKFMWRFRLPLRLKPLHQHGHLPRLPRARPRRLRLQPQNRHSHQHRRIRRYPAIPQRLLQNNLHKDIESVRKLPPSPALAEHTRRVRPQKGGEKVAGFVSASHSQIPIFAYFPLPGGKGGRGMGASTVTECSQI